MIRLSIILSMLILVSTPSIAQVWATAVSKNQSQGMAIVFRYVKEFKEGFVRAKQPNRIILMWRYEGDKGMPSIDERVRMDELEDALAPLQEEGLSTLALVSTGNNLKEWTYYAKAEDVFLGRLNEVLRSRPPFPIEIHASPDPTWTTYERFAASVKQGP